MHKRCYINEGKLVQNNPLKYTHRRNVSRMCISNSLLSVWSSWTILTQSLKTLMYSNKIASKVIQISVKTQKSEITPRSWYELDKQWNFIRCIIETGLGSTNHSPKYFSQNKLGSCITDLQILLVDLEWHPSSIIISLLKSFMNSF